MFSLLAGCCPRMELEGVCCPPMESPSAVIGECYVYIYSFFEGGLRSEGGAGSSKAFSLSLSLNSFEGSVTGQYMTRGKIGGVKSERYRARPRSVHSIVGPITRFFAWKPGGKTGEKVTTKKFFYLRLLLLPIKTVNNLSINLWTCIINKGM